LENDNKTLLDQNYAINVVRNRISFEQKQEIERILDDILPVQSGRNWRYQEITNKKLYKQYVTAVKFGDCVSKSYFLYSIVKKLNIHHSKKMKFCPICEKIENGEESEDLEKHLELITNTKKCIYDRQTENCFWKRFFNSSYYTRLHTN